MLDHEGFDVVPAKDADYAVLQCDGAGADESLSDERHLTEDGPLFHYDEREPLAFGRQAIQLHLARLQEEQDFRTVGAIEYGALLGRVDRYLGHQRFELLFREVLKYVHGAEKLELFRLIHGTCFVGSRGPAPAAFEPLPHASHLRFEPAQPGLKL